MNRRSIALMALAGLLLGSAASIRTFATADDLYAAAAAAQKGRYKQQGNVCGWTANGDGPDECEPQIKGRFEKGEGTRRVEK